MNRRKLIVMLGALVAAPALKAQPQHKRRVGLLLAGTPAQQKGFTEAFAARLRALGWEDGRNVALEFRFAENRYDRLPALAAELVAGKVELIVAHSNCVPPAQAAAAGRIPVVFTFVPDPVGSGYVNSLAHPGGSMTGVLQHAIEYGPKQLELLRQLAPALAHVGWLAYPAQSDEQKRQREKTYRNLEAAAARLGVSMTPHLAATPAEIVAAFDAAAAAKAGGMIVVPGSLYHQEAKRIAELALRHRIASAFGDRLWVQAGGLVSYGIDFSDLFARTAPYVDRILKGAKPGELPVDQVERFVTAVNRRTANALGLKVPPELLLRADEVIES